jgi:predicted phage replisome organizer
VNAVTEMADNKNYYYLRIKDNFFDTEKLVFLESLPDGFLYSNILLKLSLLSLKGNGRLMFGERIPYNADILSKITKHPVEVVEKAIDILKDFDLIKVMDNGAIYITDIQNLVGKSSTEADRKREYRKRIELEMNGQMSNESTEMNGQMSNDNNDRPNEGIKGQMSGNIDRQTSGKLTDKSTPELELELKKDLDLNTEREQDLDSELDSDLNINLQAQQLEQKRLAKIAEINKHTKPVKSLVPLVTESAPPPPPPPSEKNDISLSDEDIKYFIHSWNNLGVSEPLKEITFKQIQKLDENVKQFGDGRDHVDTMGYLFDSITDSKYLMGEADTKFDLMLNWVLKAEYWKKIIDGEYCSWDEPESED